MVNCQIELGALRFIIKNEFASASQLPKFIN
jgi:hypothetical protein